MNPYTIGESMTQYIGSNCSMPNDCTYLKKK